MLGLLILGTMLGLLGWVSSAPCCVRRSAVFTDRILLMVVLGRLGTPDVELVVTGSVRALSRSLARPTRILLDSVDDLLLGSSRSGLEAICRRNRRLSKLAGGAV